MHQTSKKNGIKRLLYLLLLVTFFGSIFFVLYTNTTNAQTSSSLSASISQETAAQGDSNDTASAGNPDDVAEAYSANLYLAGADQYSEGNVTATLSVHGYWRRNYRVNTSSSVLEGNDTQTVEIGSKYYHDCDDTWIIEGYLDDFNMEDVYSITSGYYVSRMTSSGSARENGNECKDALRFGVKYDCDDDVTVTVYLSKINYTINFNANGGNGSVTQWYTGRDSTQNLPGSGSFSRSGYVFLGWSTSASGTVSYSGGQSFNAGTAFNDGIYPGRFNWNGSTYDSGITKTLYAVWAPIITLNNIGYDSSGATLSKNGALSGNGSGAINQLYYYNNCYWYDANCSSSAVSWTVGEVIATGGTSGSLFNPPYRDYQVIWTLSSAPSHPGYNTFDGYSTVSSNNNNMPIGVNLSWVDGTARSTQSSSAFGGGTWSTPVLRSGSNTLGGPTSLYARYSNPKAVTVTINLNDGTGSTQAKKGSGTYYIAENVDSAVSTTYNTNYRSSVSIKNPIRPGYIFSGWTNGGYGQTSTPDSNQMNFTAGLSTTLTAVWTPRVYAITLNNNPITLNNSTITNNGTQTVYYKFDDNYYTTAACTATLASISIPARSGYVFAGYYTAYGVNSGPSGTQFINSNGQFVNNLYQKAAWSIDANNNYYYDYDSPVLNATLYASYRPRWEFYVTYNTAQNINNFAVGTTGGDVAFGTTTNYNLTGNSTTMYTLLGQDSGAASYSFNQISATAATGYSFAGWFDAITGGTAVSTDAAPTLTNGTYYARFCVNSYWVTISWDAPSDGVTYQSGEYNTGYGTVTTTLLQGTADGNREWVSGANGTSYRQKFYYGSQLNVVVTERAVYENLVDTGRKYAHFDNWTNGVDTTSLGTASTYSINWLGANNFSLKAVLRPVWSLDVLSSTIANQIFVGNNTPVSPLQTEITILDTLSNNATVNNAQTTGAITWTIHKENPADGMGWSVKYINDNIASQEDSNIDAQVYALISYTGSAYYGGSSPIKVNYRIAPRPLTTTNNTLNTATHGQTQATANSGSPVAFNFTLPSGQTYTYYAEAHLPSLATAQYNDTSSNYNLLQWLDVYNYHACDYVLSYGTNINAGTGYVYVNGRGNFTGQYELTFTINPLDINNIDITATMINQFTYNTQKIAPNTFSIVDATHPANDLSVLYDNGLGTIVHMQKGASADFTISEITGQDYVNVGTPTFNIVAVEGKNFTGTRSLSFVINPRNINDAAITYIVYPVAGSDGNGEYTLYYDSTQNEYVAGSVVFRGSQFKPLVSNIQLTYEYATESTVTLNAYEEGFALLATNTYGQNLHIGTGTVKITGINNYTGERTLEFTICKKSMSGVFAITNNNTEYNGTIIDPQLTFVNSAQDSSIRFNGYNQGENDYTIAYSYDNAASIGLSSGIIGEWRNGFNVWDDFAPRFLYAGRYTIVFTATQDGDYAGTQTVYYTIASRNIGYIKASLANASVVHSQTVTYNGMAQKPTVYVSEDLTNYASAVPIAALYNEYVIQVSRTQNGTYESYDNAAFNWTNAGKVYIRIKMQHVTSSALNNYSAAYYTYDTNKIELVYTINPYTFGAGDSVTLISPESAIYTGQDVTLGYTIYANGYEIGSNDYIATWANNTNVKRENDAVDGTVQSYATLTITGKGSNGAATGNFAGTLTANFAILPRDINGQQTNGDERIYLSSYSHNYDGNRHVPTIESESTLSTIHDIRVSYVRGANTNSEIENVNFTDAGQVVFEVSGVRNYTGTKSMTYTILQATISGFAFTYSGTQMDGITAINGTSVNQTANPVYTGNAYQITSLIIDTIAGSGIVYTLDSDNSTNLLLKFVHNNTNDFDLELSQSGEVNINWTDAYVSPIAMALRQNYGNYNLESVNGTFDIQPAQLSTMQDYINDIADQVYTGGPITPNVTFSFDGIVAADYLVSEYQNNTNVTKENGQVVAGAVVIISAQNRNFTGNNIQTTFKIVPQEIVLANVAINTIEANYEYNGSSITPQIQNISFTNTTNNVVHTVYLQDLVINIARTAGTGGTNNYVNVGTFAVSISIDSDNYVGTASATYNIIKKRLTQNNFVLAQSTTTYNAQRQNPVLTIGDIVGGVDILNNTDYSIVYYYGSNPSNTFNINSDTPLVVGYCTNAGTIGVVIKALTTGNYYIDANNDMTYVPADDDYYGAIEYTYTIERKSLAHCTITFPTYTYTGEDQIINPTITDDVIVINNHSMILTLGTDYALTVTGEILNANGVGNVVVTGQGNFKDSNTASFSIDPKDIADATITIFIPRYAYSGSAITPNAVVTDTARGESGVVLSPVTEYQLYLDSNADNVNKGNVPITINGLNNYTGHVDTYFSIIEVHINALNQMTIHLLNDVNSFTFNNAVQKPTVTFISIDLYDELTNEYLNTVIYFPNANELVYAYDGDDGLTAQQVFVYTGNYHIQFVSQNPNYVIDAGYENVYNASYQIVKKEITNDMFAVQYSSTGVVYDGASHQASVVGTHGTTTMVQNTDYVVSYYRGATALTQASDFVNAGTISVNIDSSAARNYSGTLDPITYVINPKSVATLSVAIAENGPWYYTGNSITPSIIVTDPNILVGGNPATLVLYNGANGTAADYRVEYVNSVNVGTATIRITGMNNYDEATVNSNATFAISKALLDTLSLTNTSVKYNRTPRPAVVSTLTSNTVALPSADDYDIVYYRLDNSNWEVTSDITNAGALQVRAVAKASSQNFTGMATVTYTITPAIINDVTLDIASVVYDLQQHYTDIINVASVGGNVLTNTALRGSVVSDNGLVLDPSEYSIALTRNGSPATDYINAGTIRVTITSNNTNFADKATAEFDDFVINPKTLEDETKIEVRFYRVDSNGDPVLDGNGDKIYQERQFYVGEEVAPEIRYYYDGVNSELLVQTTMYTYTYVPTYWGDACLMTFTILGVNGSNYTGTRVCRFQVMPLPWNTTNIQIIIANKYYTGLPITLTAADITATDVANNLPLTLDTDFEIYDYNGTFDNIQYSHGYYDNVEVGRASVLFHPKDANYNQSDLCMIQFSILPRNINDYVSGTLEFEWEFDSTSFDYDREEHKPVLSTATYFYSNGTTTYNHTMTSTDYYLTYTDTNGDEVTPVDADDYYVVINGTGNFTGTKQTAYRINKKSLSALSLTFANTGAVYLENTSQKPQSVLYYATGVTTGFALVEGTDYVATYEYANFINNTYAAITDVAANFINAGNYRVTLTAVNGSNYMDYKTEIFVLNRDTLSAVRLSRYTVVYNRLGQAPNITIEAQNNSVVTTITPTYAYKYNNEFITTALPDFVNAGTIRIRANAANEINYQGDVYADFVIEPKQITRDMITMTANFTYNRSAQEATIVVVDEGTTLQSPAEYSLAFADNINASTTLVRASVTVFGEGNYTAGANGIVLYYDIAPCNINNITFDASAILDVEYTGFVVSLTQDKLAGVLMHGDYALVVGQDFDIIYPIDNPRINVSTYNITITGTNNYTGSKAATFDITPQDLANDNIEVSIIGESQYVYCGENIQPNIKVVNTDLSVDDDINLNNQQNYTISYADNKNVTWNELNTMPITNAKIIVSGNNNYTGSKTVYFLITPLSIDSPLVLRDPATLPVQRYQNGSPVTPTPVLTFKNETISVSYSYTNNTSITEDASVIIVAAAGTNFTGSVTMTFTIDSSHISWAVITGIHDVNYDGEEHRLVPTLTYEGTLLQEGRDYDYTIEYQYERNLTDVGTVTIVITGGASYRGSTTVSYEILPITFSQADITNSNVIITGVSSKTFNGDDQTQDEQYITFYVSEFDLVVPSSYYQISYSNNKDAGTATMTFEFLPYVEIIENSTYITVRNNFGGTLDYNFTIAKRTLAASLFGDIQSQTYNHEEITPDVLLVLGTHSYNTTTGKFDVVYGNNINVSRDALGNVIAGATIDVTAQNDSNFEGSVQLTFTINPKVANVEDFSITLDDDEFIYNGIEQCPQITLLYDIVYDETMQSGVDYDANLDYQDNINASISSNAKIIVQFINNYQGLVYFEFTIQKASISGDNVAINPSTLQDYDFDGTQHCQEITLTFTNGNGDEVPLDGTEYEVLYSRQDEVSQDNKFIYVGTIYVRINATENGNFAGFVELSYQINTTDISTAIYQLENDPSVYIYKGSQITPEVTLKLSSNYELTSDDYSLSYGENTNVVYNVSGAIMSGATINIAAKPNGNFTGNMLIRFTIQPRNIGQFATIAISEEQTIYNAAAQLPTTITINDATLDRDLVENTEYTLSNTANILPGVVVITATGKGNFTGILTIDYTILARTFSQDENLTFTWLDNVDNIIYNRAEQTPNFEIRFTADNINDLLESGINKDYIFNYENNINASTDIIFATVHIQGVNGYSGEYTATFVIKPYDITNLLQGQRLSNRKYDGESQKPAILSQIASFMVYHDQMLDGGDENNAGDDYSVVITRVSGDVVASNIYVDVGQLQVVVSGHQNFTGDFVMFVNIVSKEIDNLLIYIDDVLYYGDVNLTYKGYAYTLRIEARSGIETIEQDGYILKYYDQSHNELNAQALDLENVNEINIELEGTNNYMGYCSSKINIAPKSLQDDDVVVQNFNEHITYYYGVEREQNDVAIYFDTDNNNRITLRKGVDYDVVYYNNAYVGRASMIITGKGNYDPIDRLAFAFTIDKMVANIHPSIANTTYFAGDAMPTLRAQEGDTNGVLIWDNATKLILGQNNYTWTFVPTDISNYAGTSGTISINAIAIMPESLVVEGDYKTEYYVYELFTSKGLIVYLLYNNGTKVLLDKAQYTLNTTEGQQLRIDTVPMVRYDDGQSVFERALGINISQIPIIVEYPDTQGLIQTEQAQYITPVVTNNVNSYIPGVITRYYSHKLQAYTDGITQGGDYTISVLLVSNDFVIESGASTDIYVKTGVIKSSNGLVTLIDAQGFDDGVYLSFREFEDANQLSKLIDLNTFNVKKFYEIQLWKGTSEYVTNHNITIRINIGRDVLEGTDLIAYNVPISADSYSIVNYDAIDKDNIEVYTNLLGGFVFGEKTEAPSDAWWIIVAGVSTGAVVAGSITAVIIFRRRRIKAITKSLNIKLGK